MMGFTIVTTTAVVEAKAPEANTSAQRVELIALTRCCKPRRLMVRYIDPNPSELGLGMESRCLSGKDVLLLIKRWVSKREKRREKERRGSKRRKGSWLF